MLPELGGHFGISSGDATVSVTAYLLPFAGLMLFSGTWGTRWGRSRTIVAAYLLYVVASLACVLAPTWTLFLTGRALQGVANAFTTPLLMVALAAATPPARLGRALGWLGSLQAAGQTSAPLLGGLAAEVDWRWAFGGAALVAAGLALVGIPAGESQDAGRPTLRSAIRPEVLRLGLVLALGWGWVGGVAFLVALRLEEGFGLDASARGLVLTAAGVVGLLSAPLVGRWVDRIGPRRTLLLGVGLGAVVVAGTGLAPAVGLVVAVWALGGLAGQLVVVGANSLLLGTGLGTGRGPGQANTGGATSVVQAVRFGGTAVAPVAFTPIYHADPLAAFLVPAVTIAVVAPLALPRAPR